MANCAGTTNRGSNAGEGVQLLPTDMGGLPILLVLHHCGCLRLLARPQFLKRCCQVLTHIFAGAPSADYPPNSMPRQLTGSRLPPPVHSCGSSTRTSNLPPPVNYSCRRSLLHQPTAIRLVTPVELLERTVAQCPQTGNIASAQMNDDFGQRKETSGEKFPDHMIVAPSPLSVMSLFQRLRLELS
ncbi:hypothetical protein AAHC03_021183 [Spirometra sp. Aus1]